MTIPDKKKLILIARCLAYLESLPEFALEDAVAEIEKIADFYCDRVPPKPSIRTPVVKGKLTTPKIRPPIILDR